MRIDIIHAYRVIRLSRSSERPGCAVVTETTASSARSRRLDIYPPHQHQRYAALFARAQPGWKDRAMTDRTYRVTEIVGTSKEGVNQAITNGITRAGETLRHLDWFEVTEIRGHIVDNQIDHYQVGMKVGFRLEDA
jgi:flavin-binding protein dodecin